MGAVVEKVRALCPDVSVYQKNGGSAAVSQVSDTEYKCSATLVITKTAVNVDFLFGLNKFIAVRRDDDSRTDILQEFTGLSKSDFSQLVKQAISEELTSAAKKMIKFDLRTLNSD